MHNNLSQARRKKVLLITRPITPPWDEASKNFAYTLAKSTPEVEFGLLTKGILPDLPANVRQHPIYDSGAFGWRQKIQLLLSVRRLRKEYDILHYLFTPTRLNSFLIRHFLNNSKKIKTIQTVATLREDLFSDMEIKKMMFGDLIVTYSDYAKNRLNDFGFSNVRRVYPGIDMEKYKRQEKHSAGFTINFSGEYTRLGAIDLVVDSFIAIAKDHPDIRLSLAVRIKNEKDAAKKKEVVEKFAEAGLSERVTYHLNKNDEMNEIYNLADISIFPVANMYGKFDIPLAVVEAMACEKPVILSDIPILAELGNGPHSVIIEKGDQKGLIDKILEFHGDPARCRELGRLSRRFVQEKFDIKNSAANYQEIYEKL